MYTEYLTAIKHAVMLTYILGETGLHILFVRRAAVIFFFTWTKGEIVLYILSDMRVCTIWQTTWKYKHEEKELANGLQ